MVFGMNAWVFGTMEYFLEGLPPLAHFGELGVSSNVLKFCTLSQPKKSRVTGQTRFEQRIVVDEAGNVRGVVVGSWQRVNGLGHSGKPSALQVPAQLVQTPHGPGIGVWRGHLHRPIAQRINHK